MLTMNVFFAIPLNGQIESRNLIYPGLLETYDYLKKKGVEFNPFILKGCANVSVARNTLVSLFVESEADNLFFIDADVGFSPEYIIKILEKEEDVVAGVYPFKKDDLGFPVVIKTKDGTPVGREFTDESDYLIEADYLPTGFMKISRKAIVKMQHNYPELKYSGNDVLGSITSKAGGYGLFDIGTVNGKRFATEDYAFCERWTAIGGRLWVYPNINFEHVGRYSFKGNYHEYLLKGGR